jgi:serine/threonine protein kinase
MALTGQRDGRIWNVIEKLEVKPSETPGQFSVGYLVEAGGERAFLKASDLGMFIRGSASVLDALNQATTAHAFERDVLEYCRGNAMDRIVTAVDFGDIEVDFEGTRDFVFFLVFELAQGDIRSHVTRSNSLNLLWAVNTLHNVAVATSQLHAAQVAHNDLKPSNTLIIDEEIQKVADLGRATSVNHPARHDALLCTGDRRFAPPEQLYPEDPNCGHLERETRRRVGDLYNLGSLIYFMVTSRMLTPEIIVQLRPEMRPRNLRGGSQGSYQAALPYWADVFALLAENFVELGVSRFGPGIRSEIEALHRMVKQLCEPDPLARGHPQNRTGLQDYYALNRYITELDSLRARLRVKAA